MAAERAVLDRPARRQVHRHAGLGGARRAPTRSGRWWRFCCSCPTWSRTLPRAGAGRAGRRQATMPGSSGLADPFEPVLAGCARCHGRDGAGRGVGAFPILAGQSEAYLFASLQAYATGRRHSGIMQPAAVPLDEAQMRRARRHYAAGRRRSHPSRGRRRARRGDRAPRRAGRRHPGLRLLPRAAGRPLPGLSGPARPDAGLPRAAAAPVPRRRPRRHRLRPHHGDDRAAA